ncbi:MAG: molybdopterin-dependent oxidoreductase [Pseudomonadota bacterium]
MKKETGYRTCPLCEATCGLEIILENGRPVKVRGDKDDVFSRGYLCPKGAALADLELDPDRLRRPLVRKNGRLEDATWDEAFQEVEKRLGPILKDHGRDAAAVYLGNPNVHTLAGQLFLRPLIKALGTKNVYSSSTVDQMPKQVSCGFMFGSAGTIPVPDLDRTSYLLMIGANPLASNGSLCTAPDFPGRLRALRSRGGKLVVVDPRRTKTAELADRHVFIRPGTDPYLLLGLIHVLFAENLVKPDRLAPWLNGLEKLKELVRDFTPDEVARVTGAAPEITVALARELAQAPTAAVYGRMGVSTVKFGTLANFLVDALNVLTGNLDRPGGAMFALPAHARLKNKPGGRGFTMGRWKSRVKGLPEVCGELPAAALAEEIETPGPGQVKALFTVAANPVLTLPDGPRLEKAFSSLDFYVAVDFYVNETTRLADVILPPAGPLCSGHYDLMLYGLAVRNIAKYSPPALASDGLDKWEILAKLALVAAGQGAAPPASALDDFAIFQLVQGELKNPESPAAGRDPAEILQALAGRKGPERMLDFLLRTGPYGDWFGVRPEGLTLKKLEENPHGLDLGPLEPRLPQALATPSAKIELAPEQIVADIGRLREENKSPAAGLLLVGRRSLLSNNSWMHNIPRLVNGKDRCTLLVHPADAGKLGLEHGEQARVASDRGQVVVKVEITDEVMPGVVSLPHGWGHTPADIRLSTARSRPGVNSNVLADLDVMDPLSGTSVLNGLPVRIEPVVA